MRKLMCLAAAMCLLTAFVSGCKQTAGNCDCCDGGCAGCAHSAAHAPAPVPVHGGTVVTPTESIPVKPMPK